jgi:7-cyano-7-deazaguanine reductase
MSTQPRVSLPPVSIETFPNPAPERDYTIRMTMPEFTCLCPKTGQPDFATLKLEYVPDLLCVELKALKLYLWSFRDRGCFHEAVTNEILDHLAGATRPRYMRLTAEFYVRGGIYTTVVAQHAASGWSSPPAVQLP